MRLDKIPYTEAPGLLRKVNRKQPHRVEPLEEIHTEDAVVFDRQGERRNSSHNDSSSDSSSDRLDRDESSAEDNQKTTNTTSEGLSIEA